ncbi:hypothetical protein RIF29_15863 [Crotalaria pallida]|uniref:Uncharacterized protein n=1 Tax=Crotalaria pallida TaxID=3830 RepID=A0AAN9IF19_CROPI
MVLSPMWCMFETGHLKYTPIGRYTHLVLKFRSASVRPPRGSLSQSPFSIQCLKPRLLPKPLSSRAFICRVYAIRACCAELMSADLVTSSSRDQGLQCQAHVELRMSELSRTQELGPSR